MCSVASEKMQGNEKAPSTSEKEELKKIVKEHVNVIKKNILFQDFPLNGLVKFLVSCKQNSHKAEDLIFYENEPSTSMTIILTGSVSISKEDSKICDIKAPALLGEIGLFTKEPRNATVQVLDEVLSLTITEDDLNAFIQREPKLSIILYRNIAYCLRNKINNDNEMIMSLKEENSQLKKRLDGKEQTAKDEPYSEDIDDNEDVSGVSSQDRKYIRVAISNRNVCHVKIDKETYDVKDLSIGGMNIETNDSCWIEDEELRGTIFFKDEPEFPFSGTVKSIAGDTCGVKFNRVPLNLENIIVKTVNFLQRLGAVI